MWAARSVDENQLVASGFGNTLICPVVFASSLCFVPARVSISGASRRRFAATDREIK
ncbi:hypothetical protein FTUN_5095 [Frigoriglobus tundricola]|uniref:Uncharacterized protein n=1 Tax=Frigoriglobus tundricola TaxID=2774151 RepID=A0A6M5YW33_9BACT|nr:hypothetical protein FTUN_5095 [Frigoriglobus tundricola]